jgi:hypothetical protein
MSPRTKRKDMRKLTAQQRQDIARQGGKALWAKMHKALATAKKSA